MRNYIIGTVLLTSALLVGCSDGKGCCNDSSSGSLAGLGAEGMPLKGPAALFDGNWTIEKNSASAGGFNSLGDNESTDSSTNSEEAINFIFNCSDSYNQDDANISIKSCAWSFTTTNNNCLDKNSSTANIVNIKYSCNNSIMDGNMTIALTVTDDKNQTAESNATLNIKRTGDSDIATIGL